MNIKKIPMVALVVLNIGVLSGCEKTPQPNPPLIDAQTRHVLESQMGIKLPVNAYLLAEGDYGGREMESDYYSWVIFSQDTRMMLIPNQINDPNLFYIPSTDAMDMAKFIAHRLPHQKVMGRPIQAVLLRWRIKSYECDGNLLKTSAGVYCIVSRYSLNENSSSSQPQTP